jgi:hypothetical protein
MMKLAVFSPRNSSKQFLIPGLWYDPQNQDHDMAAMLFNAMTYSVVLNLDPKWVEIETNSDGQADLSHHEEILCHRGLAHGGIKVLILENPL